jgi:hypothetical protein
MSLKANDSIDFLNAGNAIVVAFAHAKKVLLMDAI